MTPPNSPPSWRTRLRQGILGKPRDLADTGLFHRLALIPFLAWVGLGADGLSSSSYGPQAVFETLGEHTFLALGLVVLMAGTVLLISAAYSRIIEAFPTGGGGYVVATELLGPRAGVVSGCALLVDYVLTITTSIAAAGDAIFSFLPPAWHSVELPFEAAVIVGLSVLNIRGVRESVLALTPIFIIFLVTHAIVIGGGIFAHASTAAATISEVTTGYHRGLSALGTGGMILLFLRAYSLGGGTYTGIEAVSNGLPIMREPRVRTGKRTMLYMAGSLAITASGLLLCYLLWHVVPTPGKTMNAVLVERMVTGLPFGGVFLVVTLVSEGALLVVAAQAGFIDGPRVLSNMAIDSWMPHRFSALSERLTTQNGILLMGLAALVALLYTRGRVDHLIVMYSINVFLTFSLSMFAMLRFWLRGRRGRAPTGDKPGRSWGMEQQRVWKRRVTLFGAGLALCSTVLVITVYEKFAEGGWVTMVVTLLLIALCLVIKRHYRANDSRTRQLFDELGDLPRKHDSGSGPRPLDPKQPTAVVLAGSYGGIGIHTMLNVMRAFPSYYQNFVFVVVGVVDSGGFKGEHGVADLKQQTAETVDQYVALARRLGLPATGRWSVGTDVVAEAEAVCLLVAKEFPRATFFAGKLIFQKDSWWRRVLHNETAFAIQKRLQWDGKTMMTMPVRVREE